MVFASSWHGKQAVILQNSRISAVVLPRLGGKVTSLFHREKQFELLFQNHHRSLQMPVIGSNFSKFEACGFDDAFPTIEACEIPVGGTPVFYPDHGEIWSAPFDCFLDSESVTLFYSSRILPYRYEKTFRLESNTLSCEYRIENTGTAAFQYLWAFHCLVNCEIGMRLIYPKGVQHIINVLNSASLGEAGSQHELTEAFCSLPEGPMNKYYILGKVQEGKCGYYYPKEDLAVWITFDSEKLPYLGFWCTRGGYRGDVNCAFEPASGFYDSALAAFQNKTGSVLRPTESFSFQIAISLS